MIEMVREERKGREGSGKRLSERVIGCAVKEPLINYARARRRLCGMHRCGFGERGLVVPNERVETRRGARKGPSRMGFAGKAASRASCPSAVAMATVTRVAPRNLRLFRLKRALCIIDQRFLNVSRTLGHGFLEAVYEIAMAIELKRNAIEFERQCVFGILYEGHSVGRYIADLVVDNRLLVEIKALPRVTTEHEAQVMNYLKASGLTVALLLNFGTGKLGIRRIVSSYSESENI